MEKIWKSYKNLAKIHHPDRNHNNPNAHKTFIILSKAYNCIKDNKARQQCLYNKESNEEYQGYQVGIAFPSFILEKRWRSHYSNKNERYISMILQLNLLRNSFKQIKNKEYFFYSPLSYPFFYEKLANYLIIHL